MILLQVFTNFDYLLFFGSEYWFSGATEILLVLLLSLILLDYLILFFQTCRDIPLVLWWGRVAIIVILVLLLIAARLLLVRSDALVARAGSELPHKVVIWEDLVLCVETLVEGGATTTVLVGN